MMVLLDGRGRLSAPSHPAPARREPPADSFPISDSPFRNLDVRFPHPAPVP